MNVNEFNTTPKFENGPGSSSQPCMKIVDCIGEEDFSFLEQIKEENIETDRDINSGIVTKGVSYQGSAANRKRF
jgi:hypothetical protein